MSKALVIKSADFSTNALDVIIISNPIPCTGVELNKSSETFTSIGSTVSLTVTKTPNDTTDAVSWSSSDENVATVANGVVTSVGVGTATITVTCGEQTDTCDITSKAFMDTSNVLMRYGYFMAGAAESTGSNGLATWAESISIAGGLASSTGTLKFYNADAYPYVMPKGTARVKITLGNTTKITHSNTILWFNHETAAQGYPNDIKVIATESSPTFTNKVAIVNVPTVSGYPVIDSIAIGLRAPTGNTIGLEDLQDITVEFFPAESA